MPGCSPFARAERRAQRRQSTRWPSHVRARPHGDREIDRLGLARKKAARAPHLDRHRQKRQLKLANHAKRATCANEQVNCVLRKIRTQNSPTFFAFGISYGKVQHQLATALGHKAKLAARSRTPRRGARASTSPSASATRIASTCRARRPIGVTAQADALHATMPPNAADASVVGSGAKTAGCGF